MSIELPAANAQQRVNRCELCGRDTLLTRHHLIPRTRQHNKRTRRLYSREEMQARVLWVCRACHNHIHYTFSEKELAATYNTRESLVEHIEIKRFVDWLKHKPAGFKPRGQPRRH